MLIDIYGRTINYIRISITDRCELKCRYCIPPGGIDKLPHDQILTFREIACLTGIFRRMGIEKIRFTGGEPFLRKRSLDFFETLDEPFNITTCLSVEGLDIQRINRLKLDWLNISLDTLDPDKYRWLTRGGDLNRVLDNIKKIKLDKIKINTVLIKGFNELEVQAIIDYANFIGAVPRFIEMMDIKAGKLVPVMLPDIKEVLLSGGIIHDSGYTIDNSVAVYHRQVRNDNIVGFIAPVSGPFCYRCNKIRLKANGDIKLCLFDAGINIRESLRSSLADTQIEALIKDLIKKKPAVSSSMLQAEGMVNIGG